jgi:hypothetical protein
VGRSPTVHTFEVTLDNAFQSRLLGLRFIQADLIPVGKVISQTFLPRNEAGVLLGPGEGAYVSSDTEADTAASELFSSVIRTKSTQYVVLTDAGRKFTFRTRNDAIEVQGRPFYYAWDAVGERVQPDNNFNRKMEAAWGLLQRANPVVVRAIERAFRAVSFFRYEQKQSPEDWASFSLSVSKVSLPPVPTPRNLGR